MLKLVASLGFSLFALSFLNACQSSAVKASSPTPAITHPDIDSSKAPRADVFDSPESAHWVPEVRSWFVSSMGGPDILAKDNYGWITRLDEKGNVVNARWVQNGLHAPSGLCHIGKELYAVDRDGLAVIDIEQGKLLRKIELPGIVFPNDSACDPKDHSVYVTDMSASKIYRWKPGMEKAEVWLDNKDLDTPNGIEIDGQTMWVVTWGPFIDEKTSNKTSRPGHLRSIDMKTKKINLGTGDLLGNMDGVAKAGKYIFATDWMGGRIFRFDEKKKPEVWATGFSHVADIGYSKELQILAVPEFSTNRVYFFNLK